MSDTEWKAPELDDVDIAEGADEGFSLLNQLARGWEPPDGDGRDFVAGIAFGLIRDGSSFINPEVLDRAEAEFLAAVEAGDFTQQAAVIDGLYAVEEP